MTVSDWLFGTCGRSHIGIYVCSRCGYELVRSDLKKGFVFRSTTLQDLLPLPMTVAAEKGSEQQQQQANGKNNGNNKAPNNKNVRIVSRTPFNNWMVDDFTKNVKLNRIFHKNSLVTKAIMQLNGDVGAESPTNFKISCGKCGSSLGHQLKFSSGLTKFSIKPNRVDLTFRST